MVSQNEIVTEAQVLRATTVYLVGNGATPYQFSIASGKGIDAKSIKSEFQQLFLKVGHNPSFVSNGPDIMAISDNEWWIIECKGSGTGKPQTQRNNFDRALASVVSYFEDSTDQLPKEYQNVEVKLGLAIPSTDQCLKELKTRVRKPLRKRLNLCILLYDVESKKIVEISPDQDL